MPAKPHKQKPIDDAIKTKIKAMLEKGHDETKIRTVLLSRGHTEEQIARVMLSAQGWGEEQIALLFDKGKPPKGPSPGEGPEDTGQEEGPD